MSRTPVIGARHIQWCASDVRHEKGLGEGSGVKVFFDDVTCLGDALEIAIEILRLPIRDLACRLMK